MSVLETLHAGRQRWRDIGPRCHRLALLLCVAVVFLPVVASSADDANPGDPKGRFQPVVPFHLSAEWNLITRTILPVIHQDDIFPGAGSQFGLGDLNLSLFVSPREPARGVIWGLGPVLLAPTATDDLLGAGKWGAGPAAVGLAVMGPWTVGVLANHLWSYAGDPDRRNLSNTFLQPFAAYTLPSAWTLSLQSESTYN